VEMVAALFGGIAITAVVVFILWLRRNDRRR
jgi:hypothetical protein